MTSLVLLPGMDGTGRLFGEFVEALDAAIPPLVVSYPDAALGYGDLERVARERLPARSRYALLGESFSGPVAVSVAASAPPGLCGLILCCSFVRNPRPALGWLGPAARMLPIPPASRRLAGAALLGRFDTPALRRDLHETLSLVSAATLRARIREVLAVDVTAQLSKVRVPVLCLVASEDRVVPRSAARRIAATFPSARIAEVEGPHLLLQAVPRESAEIVRDFLRGLGG